MKDPLYERAKSKIQLAAYFAKEMIEELGKEKALEIIGKAYQKYSNEHLSESYLDIPIDKRFPKFKEDLKEDPKGNLDENISLIQEYFTFCNHE